MCVEFSSFIHSARGEGSSDSTGRSLPGAPHTGHGTRVGSGTRHGRQCGQRSHRRKEGEAAGLCGRRTVGRLCGRRAPPEGQQQRDAAALKYNEERKTLNIVIRVEEDYEEKTEQVETELEKKEEIVVD